MRRELPPFRKNREKMGHPAVQESGFFGLGLIAATALLIYGMLARGLFSAQGAPAAVTGN